MEPFTIPKKALSGHVVQAVLNSQLKRTFILLSNRIFWTFIVVLSSAIIGTELLSGLKVRFDQVIDNFQRCHFTAFAREVLQPNTSMDTTIDTDTCSKEEKFWSLLLKPYSLSEELAMDDIKSQIDVGLQKVTKQLIARNITSNDSTFHTKVYQVMSDLNTTLCRKAHQSAASDPDSTTRLTLEMFRNSCPDSCEYCSAARLEKMVACLEEKNRILCTSQAPNADEIDTREPLLLILPDDFEPDVDTKSSPTATPWNRSDRKAAMKKKQQRRLIYQENINRSDILSVDPQIKEGSWDSYSSKLYSYCPSLFENDHTIRPLWRTLGLPPGTYLAMLILALDTMERQYLDNREASLERSAHLLLRMLSHKSLPRHREAYKTMSVQWMTAPLTLPEQFDESIETICAHWSDVLEYIHQEVSNYPSLREALAAALIAHGHSNWLLAGPANRSLYHEADTLPTRVSATADLGKVSSWITETNLQRSFDFIWNPSPKEPLGGRWEASQLGGDSLVLQFPKIQRNVNSLTPNPSTSPYYN